MDLSLPQTPGLSFRIAGSLSELDADPHLAAVRGQPSCDLIRRQLSAV